MNHGDLFCSNDGNHSNFDKHHLICIEPDCNHKLKRYCSCCDKLISAKNFVHHTNNHNQNFNYTKSKRK